MERTPNISPAAAFGNAAFGEPTLGGAPFERQPRFGATPSQAFLFSRAGWQDPRKRTQEALSAHGAEQMGERAHAARNQPRPRAASCPAAPSARRTDPRRPRVHGERVLVAGPIGGPNAAPSPAASGPATPGVRQDHRAQMEECRTRLFANCTTHERTRSTQRRFVEPAPKATLASRIGEALHDRPALKVALVALLALLVFFCSNRIVALQLEAGQGSPTVAASANGPASTPKNHWVKGTVPTLYQTDPAWSAASYGHDNLGLSGCGPTCLSMVYVATTGKKDKDPEEMARFSSSHGFVENGLTSWRLMSEGAGILGMASHEVGGDVQSLQTELDAGHPVIAVVGPGDFTTTGHFLVIRGVNANGTLSITDPNSQANTEKEWDAQQVLGQTRNLWSFTA